MELYLCSKQDFRRRKHMIEEHSTQEPKLDIKVIFLYNYTTTSIQKI